MGGEWVVVVLSDVSDAHYPLTITTRSLPTHHPLTTTRSTHSLPLAPSKKVRRGPPIFGHRARVNAGPGALCDSKRDEEHVECEYVVGQHGELNRDEIGMK